MQLVDRTYVSALSYGDVPNRVDEGGSYTSRVVTPLLTEEIARIGVQDGDIIHLLISGVHYFEDLTVDKPIYSAYATLYIDDGAITRMRGPDTKIIHPIGGDTPITYILDGGDLLIQGPEGLWTTTVTVHR